MKSIFILFFIYFASVKSLEVSKGDGLDHIGVPVITRIKGKRGVDLI